MEIIKRLFSYLVILMVIEFGETSHASFNPSSTDASSSSCGNVRTIRSPFQLGELNEYSRGMYKLYCESNRTVIYLTGFLPFYPSQGDFFCHKYFDHQEIIRNYKYFVEEINYEDYTVRLVDPNVRHNDCSSIPRFPLTKDFLSQLDSADAILEDFSFGLQHLTQTVTFLSCKEQVNSSSYIDTNPCIKGSTFSRLHENYYSYVVVDQNLTFSDLKDSCRIELFALISMRKKKMSSFAEVHAELSYGFELSFRLDHGYPCDYWCKFQTTVYFFTHKVLVYIEIPRMVCLVLVIAILAYTWYKRHSSMFNGIEDFLQSNNDLIPIRYSYWEIIIMTKFFREKLGEGGFGSVYKGKLSNNRLVAVKMLGKSKGNGQDFMNEVTTIGRIHHVNVVHLIGFCAIGSKRALVYDFMPNRSLEKHIFTKEGVIRNEDFLNPNKILEISIGISRGISYLHQGCNMQILHFDIKPHNILLDENFVPKVSDFGLARSCPLENSIISMTAARGTLGYIAPELFYKNIGGVSHKSDVYSFGMLLFEMASKRKNVRANAEKTSQIYFPTWIYDHFDEGNEVVVRKDATGDEIETVKKMIVVALWCIQLKPGDRPSMSKVIEMLEGEFDGLEMPPKPCLYPQEQENEIHNEDAGECTESSWCSTPSVEDSAEI